MKKIDHSKTHGGGGGSVGGDRQSLMLFPIQECFIFFDKIFECLGGEER